MKIPHTGEGIYSSVNGSAETRFVYEMEYRMEEITNIAIKMKKESDGTKHNSE